MLKRWDRFAGFIEDGRICLSNNAAERALRGFALGRKSWLFAASERGADRAAAMATLIGTAKLNDIDPQAWLADVLARIADRPQGTAWRAASVGLARIAGAREAPGMSHVDRIARLKIALDNWQPTIWRRVEVPLTASLKAVHDVIQAVMPFDDTHLFKFRAGGQRYAIPDPEWDLGLRKTISVKTTKLGVLAGRGITELGYTYDFGDDWRHTITIEATDAADPATDYPRYLDGARAPHPRTRPPGLRTLPERHRRSRQ